MNFVIIPKKVKTNKNKFITSRNFTKLDVKALLRQLDKLPWTVIEVFDNIDDCWHVWKTLFNSVVDELCPMKKFRPRKKICPWYSEEIETLKILRDQLHNRAILTNDSDDWSKWKKCKNRVTSVCRKAKAEYIETAIKEGQGDSRVTWRALRTLMPKCKSQGIQALEINGQIITDPTEISNSFNKFFINIGEQLANLIPNTCHTAIQQLESFIPRINCEFTFKPVTPEEIAKLLSSLPIHKATGLDNYQAKLKLSANSIPTSPKNWKIPKRMEMCKNYCSP